MDRVTDRVRLVGDSLQAIEVAPATLGTRPRRMSPDGVRKLVEWEGCELRPYRDAAGHLTIGVGHLLTKNEKAMGLIIDGEQHWYSQGISKSLAMRLLAQDLDIFERTVELELGGISLTERECDSIISLAFNIGVSAFRFGGKDSRPCNVVRALLTNQRDRVATAFRAWKWVTKKGLPVLSPGLANRREKEIAWGEWERYHEGVQEA